MVRRNRSRGGLHRGSDELRRECRAASTDHVANGYSITDARLDDATGRAGDSYSFTDAGLDDATSRAGDGYSFTDAGFDDAAWSEELRRQCRAGDSYSFTDTGLDNETLTVATVNGASWCP